MQRLAILFFAAALAAPPARADGHSSSLGETRVLAMLKANTVVQAAVAQGRRFSGAKSCHYAATATEPREFEPGTTFDYTATITCGGGESSALITVAGRLLRDGPQALKLSLDFAG